MKKIATFLFFVLFSLPAMFAEDIKLIPKDPPGSGSGTKQNRELINVPIASIENGVINIETEFASWGVAVCVFNSNGAVVYSSVSNTECKSHSFAIEAFSADEYTLEVQIGENYYEGEFTIN